MPVRYQLPAGTHVTPGPAPGTACLETPSGPIRFTDVAPWQLVVLQHLQAGPATEDELTAAGGAGGVEAPAWVLYTLTRLVQLGIADRLVGDPAIAVVRAIGRDYRPNLRQIPPGATVLLSRFAYLRRDGSDLILESPRALSALTLPDWRGPAVLGLLASPINPEVVDWPVALGAAAGRELVTTLFQEGFLEPGQRSAAADADPVAQALDQWEFHDLLFHARSRYGRHRQPYGATYRYEGQRGPLPAVKDVDWTTVVPLPKPASVTDALLSAVMESRRSLRLPGPQAISIEELGEFLWRSARVRGRRKTEHEEVSNRPYPGGGADYELEIYPAIHRVAGVEPGLWYYHPLEHALYLVTSWDQRVERLMRDAAMKAPPGDLPDVLFQVTGRFQRLTYKYQSIPYAVALKDLGVLYQTFYLVATAMGLAPCAIGGGDSDLFAAVSGVPYFIEPQIGEFLLNSRNPDEGEGPPLPEAPQRA